MIFNAEQNNSIEGNYLEISRGGGSAIVFVNNLEGINLEMNLGDSSWMVGWGNAKAYFDAGNENLRMIESYDAVNGKFVLGKLLRGSGYPYNGVKVTLWSRNPSGFSKQKSKTILSAKSGWKGFRGNSIMFGKIIRDSIRKQWMMYVNETDTSDIQVYAAVSNDLTHWIPAMNGVALLSRKNFVNIEWAITKSAQGLFPMPAVNDAIFKFPYWYLAMGGYNREGKRLIGMVKTKDPLIGPFEVVSTPVLTAGIDGSWDDGGCFYPKLVKYKDSYLMFYDGYNKNDEEMLGMATSKDLLHWVKSGNQPVLNGHIGWRSYLKSSEPANVFARNDSIFIFMVGAKAFKNNLWARFSRKRFMDTPGNINDNQMGCYLSVDGGKSFVSHKNNPVFINDYADPNENDHLGASLEYFIKGDSAYIFYVAKTDYQGLAYHPFLRVKKMK